MLERIHLRALDCFNATTDVATGRQVALGQDFVFEWEAVQEAAANGGLNLDSFITLPIAARLIDKNLSSPVLFWFTPLNNLLVVTVTSKRSVEFMDPLHSMPGYIEYGSSFLRPNARPMVYWDGKTVFRVHPVETDSPATPLVADFGNMFGLTVSESDAEYVQEILNNPAEFFEYLAVPDVPIQYCNWNGRSFSIHHALCVL